MRMIPTKIVVCNIKILLLMVVAACSGIFLGCSSGSRISPADFKEGEVFFDAPKPKEWRLKNGLTVLYLEDNELPIVYGTLYLPGGTYWQSQDEMGMASAMGSQMRDGGAGNYSPSELDMQLDKLAAGISSSFSQESGSVSFSSLDRDLDQVFSMFADVVLRPKFQKERLDIWKGNTIDSIKRRIENPDEVAQIAYLQLSFGDSVFGRVSTAKDIEKISRADLLKMYSKFVKPGKALLTIGGKISEEKLNELLAKHLNKWNGEPELPPISKTLQDPKPGIYFVSLPVTQSNILIGHLGVPRLTPDYPAIDAFNEIFGSSGFGLSRLFNRIRTDLGLAYSVYGAIRTGLVKGTNIIMVQTKSQSTDVAIIESINVLTTLQKETVPPTELDEVRRSVENSFVFNFDSPSEILSRRASIKLLGFPDDFDETYLPKLREVTVGDVQSVAVRRWDLSKFVVVVVGNEDAYDRLSVRLRDDPGPLAGLSLQKVKFDQKLIQ